MLVFEMLLHKILSIHLAKSSYLASLELANLLLCATSDCMNFDPLRIKYDAQLYCKRIQIFYVDLFTYNVFISVEAFCIL
jgi:hypothetical protein